MIIDFHSLGLSIRVLRVYALGEISNIRPHTKFGNNRKQPYSRDFENSLAKNLHFPIE